LQRSIKGRVMLNMIFAIKSFVSTVITLAFEAMMPTKTKIDNMSIS
jgi:hypothetical protein